MPSTNPSAFPDLWPSPERVTQTGRYVRLEPLEPERHGTALFEASMTEGAEERFRYLPPGPQDRQAFDTWLAWSAAAADPMFFAVVDLATGRCEGRQALMRIVPEHGVIELGHILWGPRMARSRLATEAFFLAASYAFDELGYRRLEWKCHSENGPSRRAAERFGFSYEGTFRQHVIFNGRNRDTAWFSMLDREWPALRRAYEAWLAPGNFEADGRQRHPLKAFFVGVK